MFLERNVSSAVFARGTTPELPEPSGKIERIAETGLFRDLLAGIRIVLQIECGPLHPPFIQIVHERGSIPLLETHHEM